MYAMGWLYEPDTKLVPDCVKNRVNVTLLAFAAEDEDCGPSQLSV
jgi:hypothetical protein